MVTTIITHVACLIIGGAIGFVTLGLYMAAGEEDRRREEEDA